MVLKRLTKQVTSSRLHIHQAKLYSAQLTTNLKKKHLVTKMILLTTQRLMQLTTSSRTSVATYHTTSIYQTRKMFLKQQMLKTSQLQVYVTTSNSDYLIIHQLIDNQNARSLAGVFYICILKTSAIQDNLLCAFNPYYCYVVFPLALSLLTLSHTPLQIHCPMVVVRV